MTEIRHLQMVILNIMLDIDKVCQRHDIEYYLLGGSALGAIRHKGFIPWDDDLDICMDTANYNRFIKIAKEELDPQKYFVQERLVDWPLNFTKIKLKGTKIIEHEGYADTPDKQGIYVDVFVLDNSPSNKVLQFIQYVLAKIYLCYLISVRTYHSASLIKRILIFLSFPLKWKPIREAVRWGVEHYNKQETDYLGFFYGRTRFKNSIMARKVYGKPCRVPFEDTLLPVPEQYDEYLTHLFGDYMTPPPIKEQVGLHSIEIDFGEY